ncbi:MAG TPA: hypothetical protein VGC21_10260 [Telluria sp.]|jgi:hypothetical protein
MFDIQYPERRTSSPLERFAYNAPPPLPKLDEAVPAAEVPSGYRLMPVELSPAIKDAIISQGDFMPHSLWRAIIAAHDLVNARATPCNSDPTGFDAE